MFQVKVKQEYQENLIQLLTYVCSMVRRNQIQENSLWIPYNQDL